MISSQSTENPALEAIRNDIRIIGPTMRSFSTHVINEEISEFPVYVAYQDPCKHREAFSCPRKRTTSIGTTMFRFWRSL
jgi:hypothetical protein